MSIQDHSFDAALDKMPFSNGTEGEAWMENWCGRCVHDAPARHGDEGNGCPLILTAICGKTPIEWMRQPGFRLGDQYHCIYFDDDNKPPGDGWHRPESPSPGQGELFPREDFEGVRMFSDVVAANKRERVPS